MEAWPFSCGTVTSLARRRGEIETSPSKAQPHQGPQTSAPASAITATHKWPGARTALSHGCDSEKAPAGTHTGKGLLQQETQVTLPNFLIWRRGLGNGRPPGNSLHTWTLGLFSSREWTNPLVKTPLASQVQRRVVISWGPSPLGTPRKGGVARDPGRT